MKTGQVQSIKGAVERVVKDFEEEEVNPRIVIEVCQAEQWMATYGPLNGFDFELDTTGMVDRFYEAVFNRIDDETAFESAWALEGRYRLDEWHGFNGFRRKANGVGTVGIITDGEWKKILNIVDEEALKTMAEFDEKKTEVMKAF